MTIEKLHQLVLKNDIAGIEAVLKKDPKKINLIDADGRTALMHAVIDNNALMTSLLLKTGADPNLQDNEGNTALHFAALGYQSTIAALLVKSGAKIDLQDKNGNTPLSNAIFNSRNRGELIKFLTENGADKNIKNFYGVSPSDLANSIGNYDVSKYL